MFTKKGRVKRSALRDEALRILTPVSTTLDKDDTNPKDRLGALKVPLRLNPGVAIIYMALVFELGAWKYGEFNWRNKKVRLIIYSEAIDRHNLALRAGEDFDPESGLPHTAHIMACAAIIEDARACDSLIDDRFEKDMSAFVLNALTASNYHSAMLASTRTPARTLDQVRTEAGTVAPFADFLDKMVTGIKTRRAARPKIIDPATVKLSDRAKPIRDRSDPEGGIPGRV